MSSGEDTRKKRDNAQAEHEEEKPKKAKKVAGAIRTNRSSARRHHQHHHHQLQYGPLERRSVAGSECQFSSTGDTVGPATPSHPLHTTQPSVANPQSAKAPPDRIVAAASVAPPPPSSSSASSSSSCKKPKRKVWDLESALLHLVQIDSGGENEYLTTDEDNWITFRMAHAGDAAPIAHWYRQQQEEEALEKAAKEQEEKPEIVIRPPPPSPDPVADEEPAAPSSLLEHWLSEGLGDEDTCPSVYGLMAYVHSNCLPSGKNGDDCDARAAAKHVGGRRDVSEAKSDEGNDTDPKMQPESPTPTSKHSRLAAVVLLTTAWTSGERNLRIEWMAVDHPKRLPSKTSVAVQQKVWLRLASLAVMTACQLIAIDNELLKAQTGAVNHLNAATEGGGSKCDKGKSPSSKRLLPSAE